MNLLYALPLLLSLGATALPADFHLEFSINGCMGVCPVYRVMVDALGNATYDGYGFTQIGHDIRRLPKRDVQQLLRIIEEVDVFGSDFYAYPDDGAYDGGIDDMSIRMNGQERTMRGRDGPFGTLLNRLKELLGPAHCRTCVDSDQMFITSLFEGDCYGQDCVRRSKDFARRSLLLLGLDYEGFQSTVHLSPNGHVRLLPAGLNFVREVHARLGKERIRTIVRLLPELRRLADAAPEYQNAKSISIAVPMGERIQNFGEVALNEVPEADLLQKLVNDRTYTSEARSIRVEVVAEDIAGKGEEWPAEDLVPAAELAKRTFTPVEWAAIAARLEAHPGHAYAYLDGKAFGSSGAVYLIVTVSPH